MLGHLQFLLLHAVILSHLCQERSLEVVVEQIRRATPLVPFGRYDVALQPIAMPGLVLCLGLSDARADRAVLRRRMLLGVVAVVAAHQLPWLSLLLYDHIGHSPGMGQLLQSSSMLRERTTLWFPVMVPLLRAIHLCCTACGVGQRSLVALATAVHFASGHRGRLTWPFARGPCQSCLPPAISEGDIWTTFMAATLRLNCPHLSSLWPAYAVAPLLLPPDFPAGRHGTALLYHGWAVASVVANWTAAQVAVFGYRQHITSRGKLTADSYYLERPVQGLFACASLLVVADALRAPYWGRSSSSSSFSSSTTASTPSSSCSVASSSPPPSASRRIGSRTVALYRCSLIGVSLFWGMCRTDARFQPANVLYDSVTFGEQLAASPPPAPPFASRLAEWADIDSSIGSAAPSWHHRAMLIDGCSSFLAFSCAVAWAEAMPRRASVLSAAGASMLLPYVLHPHVLPATAHAFVALLRASADACPVVLPCAVAASLTVLLQLALSPPVTVRRRPAAEGRGPFRLARPSRAPVLATLVWALLVWWHGWQPPPRAPMRAQKAASLLQTPFTCTTDLASTAPCLEKRAPHGGECLSSNASVAACVADCASRVKCGGFAVTQWASCRLLGPASFSEATLRPAPCVASEPGIAMPCERKGLLCARRRLVPLAWRGWRRAFNLTLETAWQQQVPPSLCRFVIKGETLEC